VCGRGSAAEHDVLENARRRWPAVRFRVENVAVQGPYAVTQVSAALRALDSAPDVDVIVIARGGGSVEDLLPFSDESLLRVVAGCRTPVVSAIGHEQDSPLLDLVADVRASTPTDAGKRVVPDVGEELALITGARRRSWRAVSGWLDAEYARLAAVRSRPSLAEPARVIDAWEAEAAAMRDRGRRALRSRLDHSADGLQHTLARVRALSPLATLERGYAVVRRADGVVVRDAAEVAPRDDLETLLARGRLHVTVDAVHAGEPGS
jgi:exodeoxyribonuclease VII large subunit